MVLTANKKAVLIFLLFLLNITLAFSSVALSVAMSGLVQYGENIDRNRLELLEVQQEIHLIGRRRYFITGTYVILNRGDEYKATLG